MAKPSEPPAEEDRAGKLWHPAYDVFGGAALLVMSATLGGASWHPEADSLDYFFDALAVAWLVAGLVRWGLRRAD